MRKMLTQPDMILQFARRLEYDFRIAQGVVDPVVSADIRVSLNYRPPAQFFDPKLDLTRIDPDAPHVTWLTPLDVPLSAERRWASR